MHGAGNDYVYLDGFADKVPADPIEFSKRRVDRHFGIGGDGLILILPPSDHNNHAGDADVQTLMAAKVKCAAKPSVASASCFTTASMSRQPRSTSKRVVVFSRSNWSRSGQGQACTCEHAAPIFSGEDSDLAEGQSANRDSNQNGDDVLTGTCVSMGNPHVVFFVPKITDDHVLRLGPIIETMPIFQTASMLSLPS